MKTGCVALVLCLNINVDPPDVIKISPCARMECWIGIVLSCLSLSVNLAVLQINYDLMFSCAFCFCDNASSSRIPYILNFWAICENFNFQLKI